MNETLGATLLIVTLCVSGLPAVAPNPESVACAETVELFGPSGKVQSKLPEVLLLESLLLLPLVPQLVLTEAIVSPSASLIV